MGVYFAVGLPERQATDLAIGLDRALPFVPAAIFVYASVFPLAIAPLFLIHEAALFGRTALGYALCIAACGLVFWLWPVGSEGLRASAVELGADGGFAVWGVRTFYALDPPRNCFPSLHVALAVTGVLALARVDRRAGLVGGLWLAGLLCAVLLVKQHFVADAAGGIAVGLAGHAVGARRWRDSRRRPDAPASGEPRITAARVAALAAFVGGVYGVAFVLYAVGVAPPEAAW